MPRSDDESPGRPGRKEFSDRTCLIIGLIVGGLGGVFLVCGGSCAFLIYYARSAAVEVESSNREETLILQIADNEVVLQHLGAIRSVELDASASDEIQQTDGVDTWVFDVSGSESDGILTVSGLDASLRNSGLDTGTLELETGEVYDLFSGEQLQQTALENPDDDAGSATWETVDAGHAEFARQVRIDLEDHAIIEEHIGEIEEIRYDEPRSMAETDDVVFVFQLTGSKSNGTLRAACITVAKDEEDVISGELTLESGETVQLFPDNPLEDAEAPPDAPP